MNMKTSTDDLRKAPVTLTASGLNTRMCSRNRIFSPRVPHKNNSVVFQSDDYSGNPEIHNERKDQNNTVVSGLSTHAPSSPMEKERMGPKPSDVQFFAENTTFHGINHFLGEGSFSFRKFLWAVLFFTSLFLFLLQAYDRYTYYRTHPHMTKLDEQEANEMLFPAITICNLNSFRLSQVTTDDYYYAGQILGLFQSKYELKDIKYKDNKTWPSVYQKIYPIISQREDFTPYSPDFSMFEFYNRTGHYLPEIVLSCKYRGKTCRTLQDWVTIYTRYGKCYTFNSGENYPPLKTLKGGIDNGLELLLDTQQNEYMPVWDESDEISVEAGFKVQIHVQDEPPFIHELGFGVSPGFQTLVATQEQRITFLPLPWGTCVKEFDKEAHNHFDTYSISACRISCETKFVVDNCKCKMVHMPGNYSFCSPEQYKICGDGALDFLVKQDDENCVCTTPCNVTRYNLEMSTLQLPSTQATSYMAWKYNVTERYVRDNFVKLNIFFEALSYETIEQKVAYEMAGLLGDIGGQMGLFIGASILTILELFDYIYEVIKDKTWGRRLRKAKDHSEQRVALTSTADNEALSNVVSPVSQYHVIPGTVSMTTERPNNFNIGYGPLGQHFMTNNKKYLNGMGAQTYPTMPYRSTGPNYNNYNRKYETDDDYPPPPPPQYMGQSMMTLRPEHNGINDGTIAGRMDRGNGIRGNREVSLSYNDLLNLPESNGYTHHENMMQTAPRQQKVYQTSIPTMSQYDTPTRYSEKEPPLETSSTMYAGPMGGRYGDGNIGSGYDQPSMKNHGYISNDDGGNVALLTSNNETYARPMSPTFPTSYSRTMETDIH